MQDPAGEPAPGPGDGADDAEEVRELARTQEGTELERLPTPGELGRQERQQDITLKGRYAYTLLTLMGVQIAIANGVFIKYADAVGWELETGVIQAWLAATVIQIIGVVAVVVRYLFPRRDK